MGNQILCIAAHPNCNMIVVYATTGYPHLSVACVEGNNVVSEARNGMLPRTAGNSLEQSIR